MLVLSRKTQESVAIAGPQGGACIVKITVLEIREGQVRLGFEAAAEVPIHRWELWQRLAGFPDAAGASNGKGVSVGR